MTINFKIMKRHPDEINLKKLVTRLQKQIDAVELYLKKLQQEDDELTNVIIPDVENELDAKKQLLKEYKTFVKQGNELYKKEIEEYKTNFKAVLKKANQYKSDFKIPSQIRTHLKTVLKYDYKKLKHINEKVTYYLALKKEVQMCKVYKERINE